MRCGSVATVEQAAADELHADGRDIRMVLADQEVAGPVLASEAVVRHHVIEDIVGRCDHIEVARRDHPAGIDAGRSAADEDRPAPVLAS